jgi:hypothetical protein
MLPTGICIPIESFGKCKSECKLEDKMEVEMKRTCLDFKNNKILYMFNH